MPCPDQASLLKLKIGDDNKILDYTYAKYTCGKPVGLGSGLKELLIGRDAKNVLSLSPADAVRKLKLSSEDDRFLLVVELEAVTAAVASFYGLHADVTPRYTITGIRADEGFFEILQDAAPVPTAPAIPLPCSSYPGAAES